MKVCLCAVQLYVRAVSKGFVRTDNAAVQTSFLSANDHVTNTVAVRQPPLYDSGIAMVSCWLGVQCVRTLCVFTDQLTNLCRRVLRTTLCQWYTSFDNVEQSAHLPLFEC